MKKILSIFLCCTLVLSLAGCQAALSPQESYFKLVNEANSLERFEVDCEVKLIVESIPDEISTLTNAAPIGNFEKVEARSKVSGIMTRDGNEFDLAISVLVPPSEEYIPVTRLILADKAMYIDVNLLVSFIMDMVKASGDETVKGISGMVKGYVEEMLDGNDYLMVDLSKLENLGSGVQTQELEQYVLNLSNMFKDIVMGTEPSPITKDGDTYTLTIDANLLKAYVKDIFTDLEANTEKYYDMISYLSTASQGIIEDIASELPFLPVNVGDMDVDLEANRAEMIAEMKEYISQSIASIDSSEVPDFLATSSVTYDTKLKSYNMTTKFSIDNSATIDMTMNVKGTESAVVAPAKFKLVTELVDDIMSLAIGGDAFGIYPTIDNSFEMDSSDIFGEDAIIELGPGVTLLDPDEASEDTQYEDNTLIIDSGFEDWKPEGSAEELLAPYIEAFLEHGYTDPWYSSSPSDYYVHIDGPDLAKEASVTLDLNAKLSYAIISAPYYNDGGENLANLALEIETEILEVFGIEVPQDLSEELFASLDLNKLNEDTNEWFFRDVEAEDFVGYVSASFYSEHDWDTNELRWVISYNVSSY